MLETLYNARIDSPRSDNYYAEFDACLNEITFALYNGDDGEMIKEYTVCFDDNGAIDYDVEYNADNDGGYCQYQRLPRALRNHIEAMINAYLIEEAQENGDFENVEIVEATNKFIHIKTPEHRIYAINHEVTTRGFEYWRIDTYKSGFLQKTNTAFIQHALSIVDKIKTISEG